MENDERDPMIEFELCKVSRKLRAVGYLFENLNPEAYALLDMNEIYGGIGEIIGELGEKTCQIAIEVESEILRKYKRGNVKKG